MFDVIRDSDLVILLIADAALAELADEVFAALRPGSIVGLSHGYLLAHLQATGRAFPARRVDHRRVPEGHGRSRCGACTNRAATPTAPASTRASPYTPTSTAAPQTSRSDGRSRSARPYIFWTTLEDEYRSDTLGERAILLAIPHAIAEAVYRRMAELGESPNRAFERSTESMTGPLARTISQRRAARRARLARRP